MLFRNAVAAGLLLGLIGCSAPYTIRQQSRGNPYAEHGATFAVLPLDFTTTHIDDSRPETPWEARERKMFESAKSSMSAAFQKEVISYLHEGGIAAAPAGSPSAEGAAFIIRPRVLELTPGDYSGMGAASTHVRIGVAIATRAGKVIDVVEVEHGTSGDPLAGTTHERLILDGSTVGERLAGYVHQRVLPGSELH